MYSICNREQWYGAPLYDNNPIITFYDYQGKPQDCHFANLSKNYTSLLETGISASEIRAFEQNKYVNLSVKELKASSISANVSTLIMTLDTIHTPRNQKFQNVITTTGKVVRVTINNDGNVYLTPVSALTNSDTMYFEMTYVI